MVGVDQKLGVVVLLKKVAVLLKTCTLKGFAPGYKNTYLGQFFLYILLDLSRVWYSVLFYNSLCC